MKIKLLPCPFCGSNDVRHEKNIYCDDDGEHDGVECLRCDGMNRLDYWNRRAPTDNTLKPVADYK